MTFFFFFSSRRRHTRLTCDWSSDVCSSDLNLLHSPPLHRKGLLVCVWRRANGFKRLERFAIPQLLCPLQGQGVAQCFALFSIYKLSRADVGPEEVRAAFNHEGAQNCAPGSA